MSIRGSSLLQVGRTCMLWVGLWLLTTVSAGCRKYSGGCGEVLGWFSVWAWRLQLETIPHRLQCVVIICVIVTLFPLSCFRPFSLSLSGCLAVLRAVSAVLPFRSSFPSFLQKCVHAVAVRLLSFLYVCIDWLI